MTITFQQLKAVCKTEAGAKRAEVFFPALQAAFQDPKWGLSTPRRVAYFLAQILHESGEFRYTRELASGEAYNGRKDLGNTLKEAIASAAAKNSTPGPFYKGAGLIQVTGYYNFKKCSQYLFNDARLVVSPDLLCVPDNAVKSALWFWVTHPANLNKLADEDEFTKVTKAINGGVNGFQDRLSYLRRIYRETSK